ncbi:hypothetical protein ACFYY7_44850, partial [Streptomyces sp. NPDC001933]
MAKPARCLLAETALFVDTYAADVDKDVPAADGRPRLVAGYLAVCALRRVTAERTTDHDPRACVPLDSVHRHGRAGPSEAVDGVANLRDRTCLYGIERRLPPRPGDRGLAYALQVRGEMTAHAESAVPHQPPYGGLGPRLLSRYRTRLVSLREDCCMWVQRVIELTGWEPLGISVDWAAIEGELGVPLPA